jgi:hypothetical protein
VAVQAFQCYDQTSVAGLLCGKGLGIPCGFNLMLYLLLLTLCQIVSPLPMTTLSRCGIIIR